MPTSSRFLIPLLGRELAVSELANQVSVSIGAAAYRIRQMVQLGLVEQTRLQHRAGRPVAFYRAVADRFFAPLDLTPVDSLRDLFRQGLADISADVEASLEEGWLSVGRSQQWGTLLYRRPSGSVNRDFVPRSLTDGDSFWTQALSEQAPAVWTQHATLELPSDLAKQLQHELASIVTRYARQAEPLPNKRTHHIQLTLAPMIGTRSGSSSD
ncbi:winged helix-turn-helix domain-containing protein [Microlunatus soli]|nr:winged helix-turn-helix domain-containing protein [Microlunatus soli]